MLSASKFAHKWGGPYVITQVYDSGYFFISKPDLENLLSPVNTKRKILSLEPRYNFYVGPML